MAPPGGRAPRQEAFDSGWSQNLKDKPDRVGQRGVPTLIPAPAPKATSTTTPVPTIDIDTFPTLPPTAPSSGQHHKNDLEGFNISSKMAEKGGDHVMPLTPQELNSKGKMEYAEIGDNKGETRPTEKGGQVESNLKEHSATLEEPGFAAESGGLGSVDVAGQPAPAPQRTREPHRLEARESLSYTERASARNLEAPSHVETPTKTFPSDAVLAPRGKAAISQTQQLFRATASCHNNPFQSAAHRSSNPFAGNPLRGPTAQPALRSGPQLLGLAPQYQQHASLSHYQNLSHQSSGGYYPTSFAPSLGSPFKSPQHQQNARMGAGHSGPADLLGSPSQNHPSSAPIPGKENDRSQRQSSDPVQGTQNKQPQSYSKSGFQATNLQTHSTTASHPAQGFGTNQPGYSAFQSQQPSMQQFASFGQIPSNFGNYPGEAPVDSALGLQSWDQTDQQKASYTKSPSEYSFQQMPGAFDPRWGHSSFDALPPSSIASDPQSNFSLNHKIEEPKMPPGFAMSQGLSFGKQPGVVPTLQQLTEPVATQPNVQEPQNQVPQYTGRNNPKPRELAAQAQGFAQQAPRFGVSKEPLMRPPQGFDQNATSFSVSEAQNDSQIIRPPPGFEPRQQEFATPHTQTEVATQKLIARPRAPVFKGPIPSSNTEPILATYSRLGTSEPAKSGAEAILRPSSAGDTKARRYQLLDILKSRNRASQPRAQSTIPQAPRASEQNKTGYIQLLQEMGSLIAESTQQNVVAKSSGGGFSMEDLETFEQLAANQPMPAHLAERFRSLLPSDSESSSDCGSASDSDNDDLTRRGGPRTRAISPPRIIGGIHHASRHTSPRRPGDDGRARSRSSTRLRQAPMQHTQPDAQLPLLPVPPGIVFKPSPYAAARPARAGDETSIEQLNRLLVIAHIDGYLPKHMSLFNDTTYGGFEKAFPQFKLLPRASMRYRMSYEGWERINRTHVPPRIIPATLENWTNMPGSGAWFETVDPHIVNQDGATATEDSHHHPLKASYAENQTKSAGTTRPVIVQSTVLKPTTQHATKGKGPMVNVLVDEENKDISINEYAVDDEGEAAMVEHAIELSRRESLAKNPLQPIAGPAPIETSRQSKLSAEAAPFVAPASDNVVSESVKSRRGTRGRRGSRVGKESRASSQASTPSVPATPASRSSSRTSTSAGRALTQVQQPQATISVTQQGRRASSDDKLAALVSTGNTTAYIPNIPKAVNATAIRNVLGRFGRVSNLEIDRRKGCGSVEFASLAAFRAAYAANPHRIGRDAIRVLDRGHKQPATIPANARQQAAESSEKPAAIPSLTSSAIPVKSVAKPAEISQSDAGPKIAWPNAFKPVARPLQTAESENKEVPKPALLPIAKPVARPPAKPVVKAVPKAPRTPRPTSPEVSAAEEEAKPSMLLEPPKTPPKFRQIIIPATPPTKGIQSLIEVHTTDTQNKKYLALPEIEEVFENPPIIKKSAKTSKRAVDKAAKKAKALLAKEARAEVAGARLGMGKAVLEQIGALPDVETDVTITDEETGKKIKKPAAPKKIVVKGVEIIPGVDINENHSKDVYVDRSMLKDKFVVSRGQLKEVDLEKKARKEMEVAATQLAHKMRAVEMKSRGKALATSSAEDWEEEEDRMAAAESESAHHSRRGSTPGSTGGAPVLMPLGADFSQWKLTTPHPRPAPLVIDNRPDPSERPNTAMSMRSNMSAASSSFLAPFPSATLPGPKDPSLFVEPEVIPPPLNRHLVPAKPLSEIIATEAASRMRGGKLAKEAEPAKTGVPASWAQLAAGKSSASTSADTSRRGSSEVIQLRSRSVSGAGKKNFMSRFNKAPTAVQSITYDTNPENKRGVYILGISQNTNLTDISDSVSSGAYGQIYKIEFAVDADSGLRLAGVLFRDAGGVVEGVHGKGWGAIGYHHALKNARDADYLRETPLWPWPVDAPIEVYIGDYEEEDLMRRMHHDGERAAKKGGTACVTRRLCLVNGVQLHRDWHEEEMIKFCYDSGVKAGNVQKCCVHNFGNATIVFGSVEDAVMMRGKLLDKFKETAKMSVTFSSCPGENKGPVVYKRDNAYLKHLEQMTGLDVEQEIAEGYYREKKRRNSKRSAY